MGITEGNRKWWTLAGACAGLFVLMLDSTVVALALPAIRHDVDASAEGLQWVMNGYLLTIAVLVVTAGRLGETLGGRPAPPHAPQALPPLKRDAGPDWGTPRLSLH